MIVQCTEAGEVLGEVAECQNCELNSMQVHTDVSETLAC